VNEPVVLRLKKVRPASFYVRLRFRELWRAWRHGITLPADRVRDCYPFTVGAGGGEVAGGRHVGEWAVPDGVTSVTIEAIGGSEE